MNQDKIEHFGQGGVSFSGPRAVNVFACLTVVSALRMKARSGIQANRNYTVRNMLGFVEEVTKKKFKRTQLLEAAAYLEDFAKAQRATIEEVRT